MKNTIYKFRSVLILSFLILLITSCGSRQDIVYFQDIDLANASKSIKEYNPVIKPDDLLTITVSAIDSDLAKPFNLPAVSFVGSNGEINQPAQQSYLVDSNGNIEFPVLGTIKLGGLSRVQSTNLIKDLLKEYFTKPPIVNLRIINFSVTVLGEVNSPGTYTIQNDRLTILEALGLAGDLTIKAKRDNILLIREDQNGKTYNRIDLTSETVFNSPYYYLTQNDFIYVEPNNAKIKSSTLDNNTSTTLSVIGTLITAAALVVSITN